MKRLAFALVTGVGLFLHREWKKRQQLSLSESRYREDEKQLYSHFNFLLDQGFKLDETRTAYTYQLEFEKDDHFFILVMKHPQVLTSYVITPEGEELLFEEVLKKKGKELLAPDAFASYDDFLKMLSHKVREFVSEDFNASSET